MQLGHFCSRAHVTGAPCAHVTGAPCAHVIGAAQHVIGAVCRAESTRSAGAAPLLLRHRHTRLV